MKNIQSIAPGIEHFQAEIIKKKCRTENEIYELHEWPHLLELLEHANEVVGYQLIENSRNYLIPQPVFIEGYTNDDFFLRCTGEKIHTKIFEHRSMVDLNFITQLYAFYSELEKTRDADLVMNKALALTKSILKKERREIIFVSGPMSSDSTENRSKNLRIFNKSIIGVAQRNIHKKVFNQMYFENLFSLVHKILVEKGGDQSSDYFIDKYFEDLMRSDLFSEMAQIPGWKTSRGAVREDYIASEIELPRYQIDFEILLPSNLKAPVMAF